MLVKSTLEQNPCVYPGHDHAALIDCAGTAHGVHDRSRLHCHSALPFQHARGFGFEWPSDWGLLFKRRLYQLAGSLAKQTAGTEGRGSLSATILAAVCTHAHHGKIVVRGAERGAPVETVVVCAGFADDGRVDDGRQLLQVVDHDEIEQRLVARRQLRQHQVFLQH